MRVLVHICCAPCFAGALELLRGEGHEVEGHFFNPNVHPLLEFRKRVKALRVFLETEALPVEIDETYGLEPYLRKVRPLEPARCERCYEMRLQQTAACAVARKFDAFTSTLLGSKHQDHESVRRAAERAARDSGAAFLYRDFRPWIDRAADIAKKKRLYRQSYCGCVFSEFDRYRNTTRELYRGARDGRAEDAGGARGKRGRE